jgi:hypothetical protein
MLVPLGFPIAYQPPILIKSGQIAGPAVGFKVGCARVLFYVDVTHLLNRQIVRSGSGVMIDGFSAALIGLNPSSASMSNS